MAFPFLLIVKLVRLGKRFSQELFLSVKRIRPENSNSHVSPHHLGLLFSMTLSKS